MKLSLEDKWLKFFADTEYVDQKSCLIELCEYVFAIPAHNASAERIFSLMSIQRSDERDRLPVETAEAILTCRYNFKMTCVQFYNYVKGENDIMKKVKSTLKYEWAKKD
ncbi:hypothetical protein AVEN_264833-1 [Araneus ventricosus]|uniref:HAT C-terminal dimerisation domain-containing protein n=1 Tax=Araneus ventricosus TaxID=182803 RepID=A0A4Y2DX13_ARAVE|nr:hypothetical protein AVEN_264833-1 [Araneus ventricosus]